MDEPENDEAPNDDKFALVDEDDEAYALLREIVAAHHSELAEANVALVWALAIKPDRDGIVVWGKAKKVGPLERQFHAHDFVIQLNALVWKTLPASERRALLDHELMHCGAYMTDDGDVRYYLRKHDVEAFVAEVRRHGLWRENVKALVDAALKREEDAKLPLFDEPVAVASAPRGKKTMP